VSRTVGRISLGPTGFIQGAYMFLSLLTGKQIQARAFTPLSMPADVIKIVETLSPPNQTGVMFGDRNDTPDQVHWQEEDDPQEEYHDENEITFENEDDVSLVADEMVVDQQEVNNLGDVINAFEDEMVAGPGVEADDPGVEADDQMQILRIQEWK
jgi:hypothetical protein